jgi:monoamine oxidase
MGQEAMGGAVTRRQLLAMIGMSAGSAAMYQAMSSLGFAADSSFKGPTPLSAAPAGASVLILGAGIAGMVAAYEMRKAGYRVQVLEYNSRAGGRNWTLRGGDRYVELGGTAQECRFDPGLYINPGPWRLSHHHRGMLHYCKVLGVALEPFIQTNYQAYIHHAHAFGGAPQRYRIVKADYQGYVAELLAKATHAKALDDTVSTEDQEKLLESLREWGALDRDYRYVKGLTSSEVRGYDVAPGGGLSARPEYSDPVRLSDVLGAGLWQGMLLAENYDMQTTMFQPVGGMGVVGQAFARELGPLIRYNAKVIDIAQNERGVRVTYEDTAQANARQTAQADWCVCTIPLSILGQIPMQVGAPLADAIAAVPYAASAKVGLQFKRRFWEEDEQIYGGITYTNLPISNISYPNYGFFSSGKGVLLGGYLFGLDAAKFTSLSPEERIAQAVEQGSQIHPQYRAEFENGISVAWHRSPFTLGCFGMWTEAARAQHYDNLCAIDGRIVIAGEHASYMPAWQEGALTSAVDAIGRLHRRALAQGASS